MNQMQVVSAVSKTLGISSRMLRYYEQIGLVKGQRIEGYAYRVYDEFSLRRLRQIIILRKLRVPVKQIREIFDNSDAANVIDIFERNISELDEEITELSTVKLILNSFVRELREKANVRLDFLSDSSIFAIVDSISFPKNTLREEKNMDDLNKASEKLDKLTDKNVRIIYLPPMTVAACQSDKDEDNEGYCARKISKFLTDNGLFSLKPDMRSFGFNIFIEDKMAETGKASPCWEQWVSIPDDVPVPEPLFKRKFLGGLYAAHMIKMGGWDDWGKLVEWGKTCELYDFDWNPRCEPNQAYWGEKYEQVKAHMEPTLEEYLNYYNNTQNPEFNNANMQLDLLLPIKLKKIGE